MATPKNLKPIAEATALKTINKHLEAGTGEYEYPNKGGDFIYTDGRGMWLIRNSFGRYETGKVSN